MRVLYTGWEKTLPRHHQIKDLSVKGKMSFSRETTIKIIAWRLHVSSTPVAYSGKIQRLGS